MTARIKLMELLVSYDSKDDIPEEVLELELYTERDGKWEFTGVKGLKTEDDVRRVQLSLKKERDDHKTTKGKLKIWGEMDHEEIMGKLDRFDELEAAASDKLDDAAIEEIVEKRMATKLKPLERKLTKAEADSVELTEKLSVANGKERTRTIGDSVRIAAKEVKLLPTAIDDALLLGESTLTIQEDGTVATGEGLTPKQWLEDLQEKRTHWWGPSQGGGANGGQGGLGLAGGNPWSSEHWNLTEQGKIYKKDGATRAEQLAKAAGTTVGGRRPLAKVKAT